MTRCARLFAVLAFGSLLPALQAQTPAPVPAVAPQVPLQAVTPAAPKLPDPPSSSTVPNVVRYLVNPDLLKFCSAQVAEFNDRDADILFIGDSITQGWRGKGEAVWQANFAPRKALDFGISGDRTQHVLWRMENYPIARLHPKVAVVLIGTNNYHDPADQIAAGVKAVLDKTQQMYPGIKIILVSIMPNLRGGAVTTEANKTLRTFADEKAIYYLDLDPVMTPVGDNWKGLGTDHLHPDAAGYQLWADALLPLLNKLLPPTTVGTPVQP